MRFLFILLLLGLCGCAETLPIKPEPIKFDKTPQYNIQDDLNKIQKPEMINPVYVKIINNKIVTTDKSDATHILLNPQEYAKVGAVVKLAGQYKTIILDQEELVNLYIAQINTLKEIVELERQKSASYYDLYINMNALYKSEKKDHLIDNIINRGLIGILGAGLILVAL